MADGIIVLPEAAGAREDYAVAPEKLLSGDPRQAVLPAYSDPGNAFHCGIWVAEPACWRVHYTEHEYCEILEGRIRMVADSGDERVVGPGDRFVIPAGWRGSWEVLERARKIYVIYEPKPV